MPVTKEQRSAPALLAAAAQAERIASAYQACGKVALARVWFDVAARRASQAATLFREIGVGSN